MKQRLDFPLKEKVKSIDSIGIIRQQRSLKQRLDFPFQEKIETMDRLHIIQKKKSLKQRLDFPVEENIKSIKTTFRFSIYKKRLKLWIDWL